MPQKLSREEIVTIRVLKNRGVPNTEVGRTLGVTEGDVRYHLRRATEGAVDGRADREFKAARHAGVIHAWLEEQQAWDGQASTRRPANLAELYEHLESELGYEGSYKSLVRYVRHTYGRPKIRPYRRVETPPGAQAQVDWAEFGAVDIGDGPQKLFAFLMTLSHSRQEAVVWSRRMDQLAWHHCHNEAFRRLQGIPAVCRIDNLKTGIAAGAGPWGAVNVAYRTYARAVGFHVDACLPRCPEDKGKVERRVGATKRRLDPAKRSYESLGELQSWTDERIASLCSRRICPVTGRSVQESWQEEQKFLKPLPILPEVFDVVATRRVHRDATVNFDGRTYSVPFRFAGRSVEVRGCADVVQVIWEQRVVAEHRRHTQERLLVNPAHYEGPGDDRVDPPVPLGKLGRKLVEIALMPVQQRPVDLYAALAEVAR